MRLISLDVWGCRIKEMLFEFLSNNSKSTDIFCFQEVLKGGTGETDRGEMKNGFEELGRILPNHTGYFFEYADNGYYGEPSEGLDFKFGIASFIKSDLRHDLAEGIHLYDTTLKQDRHTRLAAGAALAIEVEGYSIINVHGLWQGSIKTDTEAKIKQSEKIIQLAERTRGLKVICGDFNLLPDTKAIQMLEEEYTNFIKEYEITSTRSSLYTKEIKYADYAFVDKSIRVNDFSVPNVEVSDHLSLSLDFN